jgi:hypothetical protein
MVSPGQAQMLFCGSKISDPKEPQRGHLAAPPPPGVLTLVLEATCPGNDIEEALA